MRTFDGAPGDWPLARFIPGGHVHFLHIGKCAGTSVRLLVQSCYPADESFQHILGAHGYLGPEEFQNAWRLHPKGMFSSMHLGSAVFDLGTAPLNVFTWLRDPLDAAFSILYFVTQQAALSPARRAGDFGVVAGIVTSARNPFDAFCGVAEHFGDKPVEVFHPLRPLSHLLSQPAWRHDLPPADAVRTAIQTLRKCFFIGLLEEQQTSLEMLSRFVPLRCPARPLE